MSPGMKLFNVAFYYATDRRFDVDVEARDYIHALALSATHQPTWPTEAPFEIRVVAKGPR